MRRRRDGGGVVAGEDAGLQLADPVQAGGDRQARLPSRCSLELLLVEPRVVEAAECRRQAAERPDELELCGDEADDETEPRLGARSRARPQPRAAPRQSGSPLARR